MSASTQANSTKPVIETHPGLPGQRPQAPVTQQSAPMPEWANTIPAPTSRSRYFRICGVPPSWSASDLFDVLHTIDPLLTQNHRPSLYPGCYGSTQTALLNLDPCPEHLQLAKHHQILETANRTAASLEIDSQFYNLTLLNVPKGDAVAELVGSCVRPIYIQADTDFRYLVV